MGIFAVLLHEENLLFSDDHLKDIKQQSAKMNHRGKSYFHYEQQIALSQHFHEENEKRPYQFHNNRYILLLDGVITNLARLHKLLRTEGYSFAENTAEEIIANLYLHKKTKSFSLIEGSFVLLIWDKLEKVLVGARDCFGIKQLYYTESAVEVIFSSEKKSLLFSHYEEEIDDYSFFHYLDYHYIPEPRTMTKGIRQIKKGHYFIKKLNEPIQFIRYYRCSFPKDSKASDKLLHKGIYRFHEAISTSLNIHEKNALIFNNSLASLAISKVAKHYDQDICLLSIEDQEGQGQIEYLTKKLQVHHQSVVVTPEMFAEELPRIIWLLDDPFASIEAVNYYFLAKYAKEQGFHSLMSPIGSEAVLGNYELDRRPLSSFIRLLQSPFKSSTEGFRKKEAQFSRGFKRNLLQQIVTVEHDEIRFFEEVSDEDPFIQQQYVQLNGSLPSFHLRILEKMTSSNKLTLLTPFLDEGFFELIRYQTMEDKRNNTFLRSVLAQDLSRNKIRLFEGEKSVPSLPIEKWLREDCNEWVINLISESNIDYLMSKEQIRRMLESFKERKKEDFLPFWTVFVFIIWHLIYVEEFFSFRSYGEID